MTAAKDPIIIHQDPTERRSGGRLQIGTLAGFISEWVAGFRLECMAGFIGIRTITLGEVNELILPKRTLSRRRQAGTLTPDQSDKLARVARVVAKAEKTFGNKEKARRWLRRPTAPLNNEEPLKLLDTEAGARMVEDLLVRIDHGIAA